ncbi:gpW family head-tail joining protein [Klebsiella quasipneumoniae]|uniref:gpW family head-tail joining protein n=1 Tax=Klebsiella quasipneumoniae TaxID=1463165 RepID=UPI00352AAA8F
MYTQLMLDEARRALHDLLTGNRVVSVSKDGRQVQFSQADIVALRSYIIEIELALGLRSRRGPPAGVRA